MFCTFVRTLAALAALAAAKPSSGAEPDAAADKRFPTSAFVLDVTRPPYSAKGDGTTDDTAALQKALDDAMGRHKVVYLPSGTYLVSATLNWKNKQADGKAAWGKVWVQGQNVAKTVVRLKDGTFTDPKKPQAVMWGGGFGSADWFHNYVQDITFDVGSGNPGAVGLQFYSNNIGAVRDCAFASRDGQGAVGLDLGHRDMNGPLLVQRVRVTGFRVGVSAARAVNSQTFEFLTLSGQSEVGFENQGQAVAVRGLRYDGPGLAVKSYGTLALLDCTLTGRDGAKNLPAVVNYNGGRIALRDVTTRGYKRALADVTTPDSAAALRVTGPDKEGSEGPTVREYYSHTGISPFGAAERSLRLEVQEPPVVAWTDPKTWAVVDAFGADPTGQKDSADAIQKAIDSGASTVFLPGFYQVSKPVVVRGKVARVVGTGAWTDYFAKTKPNLIVADGEAKAVVIEHLYAGGGLEVATDRPVVLRSLELRAVRLKGRGPVFFEDVTTDDVRVSKGQKVWARQLNIENEGTHLTNDGGDVWVLGYKTERGGTLLHTKGGGRSEVFGTFSYTTTKGKLAPMFVTEDATAFAYFAEVCFNGDPFAVLVRETRGGVTKEVKRGDGLTIPYVGRPK